MEGDEQRRRQHEQPIYPRGYAPTYAAQSTNVSNPQQLRGAVQGDGSDRFRQAQLLATRAPTSAPLSAGAGVPQDMGSYSYMPAQQYTNPSMQGNQFPYQSDYLQDAQRQRYPQYQSQMMYSAPQQPQSQLSYEPIGGYQPRQTAAVEVLSSQFSVPQQYYNTAETTNTSAPAAIVQGYSTAAYQQAQQSQYSPATTLGGSTLASTYPTLAPDYSQTSKIEEPVQPGQDTDSYGEQLANYQRAICETNDNTSRGRLFEAGSSLMELSNWLLRKAGDLGLTRDTKDQPALYRQRVSLWDDFNNCWLAFLQRQKDDTQQRNDLGQPPVAPQSLLPVEDLRKMAEDLVAQCDGLERTGLVDYQMGVAEEEIVMLIYECIDLLEGDEEDDPAEDPGATGRPPAPGAGA